MAAKRSETVVKNRDQNYKFLLTENFIILCRKDGHGNN